MNNGKVIIGVLAGLATGLVLGVLFAPEEGSRTRKKITEKGSDILGALKEKFAGILMASIEQETDLAAEDKQATTSKA